jgi:aspartyl-tRNA(Asn)/glutamyl-tRNA(Gln) amidotransferase subunit A
MNTSIAHAMRALHGGIYTPFALVQQSMDAIQRHDSLNSVAAVNAEQTFRLAETRTRELEHRVSHGPLHGIPITVKDLYAVDGFPTRAGTRAPLPDIGPEGPAVRRLKQAGAIVIAKTNLFEIAAGIGSQNAWTGDVCNPHDPARQAGGSSGGSAVATAVGIGLASLGSDTAGSIRVPAALCGVTGFKPSYGRIPLDGALGLSWTCDHAGPLTTCVDDARLLTEVLTGQTLASPPIDPKLLRLGVPRAFLDGWLAPEVRSAFEHTLTRLRAAGAALVESDLPGMERAADVFMPIRCAESAFVHRDALATQPEAFSPPVRQRLLEGRALNASVYFENLRERDRLRAATDATLAQIDALLLPSIPVPAPLRTSETVALERGDTDFRSAFIRLTLPFSLVGVPALSIPLPAPGLSSALPIGLQIVGPFGADARVLAIGALLERLLAA